jgi:hypothetical protein
MDGSQKFLRFEIWLGATEISPARNAKKSASEAHGAPAGGDNAMPPIPDRLRSSSDTRNKTTPDR